MEGEVSPARWAKEVEKWEAERDSARSGQRKPGWNKPKMPSMERALPKPKVSNFIEDSKEEEEGDEEEALELGIDLLAKNLGK